MSQHKLPGLQGAIVWAMVLYENEAPFQVVEEAGATTNFATVRDVSEALRDRSLDPEFKVQVGAKVRPVLILQDRPKRALREFAALKLTRLAKLSAEDQQAVREQQAPSFFHIKDPAKFGSKVEQAVDLLALTRVHESAIVRHKYAKVDVNEFRVICERLVRIMDLDVGYLIVKQASDLLKNQGWTKT